LQLRKTMQAAFDGHATRTTRLQARIRARAGLESDNGRPKKRRRAVS
jgi:hypothetical protein